MGVAVYDVHSVRTRACECAFGYGLPCFKLLEKRAALMGAVDSHECRTGAAELQKIAEDCRRMIAGQRSLMIRTRTAVLCSLSLSSMLLMASGADGQDAKPAPGFALDRYNPAERGSEWFVVDSLDLRGHVRPAIGITLDYAHKPLAIYANADDADESVALVSGQLYAHFGGSLVLWDRVRVGLNVPLALLNSGKNGIAEGYSVTAPTGVAIGDVRLGADVRLLGVYGSPFTMTLGMQAFLPSGQPASFTGDGKIRLLPRLMAAGTVNSMFTYGAMLGVMYRANDTGFAGKETGTEFTFGASAGLRVLDGKLVFGPEFYGSTVVASAVEAPTPSKAPLELLMGAHYTAGQVRFGLGAGPGLTRGLGTPVVRVLGSIEWAPPADVDTDHDGILDPVDACLTIPGVPDPNPKKHGCPRDTDDDGIIDALDACVKVPGVPNPDPKKNGCPPDRDNDGILDAEDACPDVPGVKSANAMLNGCPVDEDVSVEVPVDRDKDGVLDWMDKCPDVPGLKEAPKGLSPEKKAKWEAEFIGCPPDIDDDKILNWDDACPKKPGQANKEDPAKHGCPVAFIDHCQIKLTRKVFFEVQKADFKTTPKEKKETNEVLNAVLKILKEHPEIKKLEVQGHASKTTDPKKWTPKDNKKLSDDRAAKVVAWLVEQGIDPSRLTPIGHGEDVPLEGYPTTPQFRDYHQRVEFHIKDCKEEPAK